MAGNRCSTESWLGPLCHSSPRATHHALQEATELSTATGESGSAKHTC
uniref:Uncharacterized protein MANES_11G152900 n=1 Tax=Rhizophora mucronata TaxID=61149 RepID=A0A2P2PRM7_RHIMU